MRNVPFNALNPVCVGAPFDAFGRAFESPLPTEFRGAFEFAVVWSTLTTTSRMLSTACVLLGENF